MIFGTIRRVKTRVQYINRGSKEAQIERLSLENNEQLLEYFFCHSFRLKEVM